MKRCYSFPSWLGFGQQVLQSPGYRIFKEFSSSSGLWYQCEGTCFRKVPPLSSSIFHLPSCLSISNTWHKEKRKKPEFIQTSRLKRDNSLLSSWGLEFLSQLCMSTHTASHWSVVVAVLWLQWAQIVGNTLQGQDPSLRSGSSQTTLSELLSSLAQGWFSFFLLIKPKLKFAELPFGKWCLLELHCVCNCACWGHVWSCICGAGDPGCWYQAGASLCSCRSGAGNETGDRNTWSWGSSPAGFTCEAKQNTVFVFTFRLFFTTLLFLLGKKNVYFLFCMGFLFQKKVWVTHI